MPRASGFGVTPLDQGDSGAGRRGLGTGRARGARAWESRAGRTPARDRGFRDAGLASGATPEGAIWSRGAGRHSGPGSG